MVQNVQEKYMVNIPYDVTVIYCEQKNLIILKGPLNRKSLVIKVRILFLADKKCIKIRSALNFTHSNDKKTKFKAIQGTTVSLIKQLIVEVSAILNQKLKLIGVGYRVFNVESVRNLLFLKLGFSHLVYFKTAEDSKVFCLKSVKLFICGHSYCSITSVAALIRRLKKPEPYKGKGILYEREKIMLKEGKKI
jgi:ribosomal protein L6P/L9E